MKANYERGAMSWERNAFDRYRKGVSVMATIRRKAAMLSAAASTVIAAMTIGMSPSHAATAAVSHASAAIPQDDTGTNQWVTMNLFDKGSQVEIHSWLNFPAPIRYSYGHWEVLTPNVHYNTPDSTYQDFDGYFPNVPGKFCVIWWYGSGSYTDEGFPCVNN